MAGLQPFGKSVAADAVTTEQLASGESLGVGAGISTRTRHEDEPPSDVAVSTGFVRALLIYRWEISCTTAKRFQTLHELAQLGDIAGFERLLKETLGRDQTLDVNERDQGDVTALHWAAINAHVGACE
jgi:hypothetical protein